MTAASASLATSVGTSANFIARMKGGISDLLKATGTLTQTADTGQITWVATYTAATNTSGGYEVFAFADALQATVPIFLKVEYGWGGHVNNPQLWLTVGTGSDGSGTITGIFAERRTLFSTSSTNWNGQSTASMCYANGSAADSAVVWGGWWGGSSPTNVLSTDGGGLFHLERSRTWDGNPSGDGCWVQANAWSIASVACAFGRFFTASTAAGIAWRTGGTGVTATTELATTTGIVGADTYFRPLYTGFYGYKIGAPSKYLVGMYRTDTPNATQVALSTYGVTKTYLAGGTGFTAMNYDATYPLSLAMRID